MTSFNPNYLKKGAKAYQEQQFGSRNDRVKEYAPLVKRIAMHLRHRLPSNVDVDDLIQSGMIGLIEAAQNYKDGAAAFETYASIRVRGAMIDHLRLSDWVPRVVHQNSRSIRDAANKLANTLGRAPTDKEVAAELRVSIKKYNQMKLDSNAATMMGIDDVGLSDDILGDRGYGELVSDSSDRSSDERMLGMVTKSQFNKALVKAIENLPERERQVISLYYDKEMNLREIGIIIGLSESRACQLLNDGQAMLREALQKDWVDDTSNVLLPSQRRRESVLADGVQVEPKKEVFKSLLFDESDIKQETVRRTTKDEEEVVIVDISTMERCRRPRVYLEVEAEQAGIPVNQYVLQLQQQRPSVENFSHTLLAKFVNDDINKADLELLSIKAKSYLPSVLGDRLMVHSSRPNIVIEEPEKLQQMFLENHTLF